MRIPRRQRWGRRAKREATHTMTRQLLIAVAALGASACASSSKAPAVPSPSPIASGIATSAVADSTSGRIVGCPGGNGIRISANSSALTDSSSGTNTLVGLGQALDTTLVFDFARKSWTRSNISAAISVGIADESRGPYAVCAGVNALLPTATLTITGARGTVHFAANLRQFTDSARVR
jgi:hypothetical protein